MLNIISYSFTLWGKEKLDCYTTQLSPLKYYSEFFSNISKWANEIQDYIIGLSCSTVTDVNAFSRKKEESHFYKFTVLCIWYFNICIFSWRLQGAFCPEIPNMTDIFILSAPTTCRFYREYELKVLMGFSFKNLLLEKRMELFNP